MHLMIPHGIVSREPSFGDDMSSTYMAPQDCAPGQYWVGLNLPSGKTSSPLPATLLHSSFSALLVWGFSPIDQITTFSDECLGLNTDEGRSEV